MENIGEGTHTANGLELGIKQKGSKIKFTFLEKNRLPGELGKKSFS